MYSRLQPDKPIANLFMADFITLSIVGEVKNGVGELVIGRGCADLARRVAACFNRFAPHCWGWSDRMGDHVSFYDPPFYVRESCSERHCYTLKIGEDKSVTISSFDDYLEERNLEYLSPPWEVQMNFGKSIGEWFEYEES